KIINDIKCTFENENLLADAVCCRRKNLTKICEKMLFALDLEHSRYGVEDEKFFAIVAYINY
ncbi:MAG: hypothetical protein ACRCUY_03105, partial [Thermoguttaceae bacterium]